MNNTIQQSADAGLAGIALWGASASFRTRTQCEATRDYIDNILGPFVKTITTFAMNCSASVCNSHGRCVRLDWNNKKSNSKLLNENEEKEGQRIIRPKSIPLLNTWWPKFLLRLRDFVAGISEFIGMPSTAGKTVKTGVMEISMQNYFHLDNSLDRRNKRGDDFDVFGCRCYTGWHGEFCRNSRD